MASLRTRSQYIPANKAPTGLPSGPAGGQSARRIPGPNLLRKDNRKSRVDEKMKQRRMSMRYAAPNDFAMSGADGPNFLAQDPYQYQYTLDVAPPIAEDDYDDEIPPPPNVINRQSTYQLSPRTVEERELEADVGERHEDIRPRRTYEDEWDFSELNKDGVDVQAFIRKNLSGADDEEKSRFIAALQKQKQSNAKELETTVFKNYAEFVSISKEISTLENDMFELKELLTEWKGVPQLMGMEDTLAPTLDKDGNVERHRQRRHSPGDLQQLYKQQVTHLWTTVEGSQKYLPIVPGRHLVYEAHTFVELNPATYKAKQNVSLFLLNDLLLVAGRRRFKSAPGGLDRDAQDRGRMVAERCWVLTDLVVVDLKDSGDLTNALKIKRGKEVCVYRGSKPEDKKALLAAFRQVSQELAERRRKENEAEQERRKTLWQSEAGPNSRMTRMSLFVHEGSTNNNRQLSTIGTSLTNSKDLLWIDDFGDDLTMAIATKDWDEAVRLFERGQDLLRTVQGNKEATEMLKFRLDSLRPPLVEKIAGDLRSSDLRKGSGAALIGLLVRLDRAELARDTFLAARHEHLEGLVRGIKHEGDIILYINELAIVCFTVIKHTFDWFNNAFNNSRLASGFVTWAKEQVEYFGDIFRRQVYAPTTSDGVIRECLRVTQNANRKQLREIGLDFTFLLTTATERPLDSPAVASESISNGGQRAAGSEHGTPRRPVLSPSANATPSPAQSADLSKGSTAPLSIKSRRPSAGVASTQSPSGGSEPRPEMPSRTQRSPQRSPQRLAPSSLQKERRPSHGSGSGYSRAANDTLAPTPTSAYGGGPSSQFPGPRSPTSPYPQRSDLRSVSNMSSASASASTLSLSSTLSGPPPTRPERRSRPPPPRSGSGSQFPHDHI